APAHRQEIGKDARHDVGRTAGRERNQKPYRPRWKIGGGLRRGNGFHDHHLRFAVRRTLPAALGWAKARKLHRDVQPVLPAVSAPLAAGEPRKKCPGNAPGRGPTTETEITADKGFDRSRTARGAAATC